MFILTILVFLQGAMASFLQSSKCAEPNNGPHLGMFIVDAKLNTSSQKLHFYITSEVRNVEDPGYTQPVIYDVNSLTNTFTTLHVQVSFLDKVIEDTYLRFCDLVSVKETSELYRGGRFIEPSSASTNMTMNSKRGLVSKTASPNDASQTTLISSALVPSLKSNIFNTSIFDYNHHSIHCPLYVNDTIVWQHETDISKTYHKLGSYTATFSVISSGDDHLIYGCNKFHITLIQSEAIRSLILGLVITLILVTALANFFTVMYSSYQESSNPLLFLASTICNEKLLRQLENSVYEIILYLQHALFLGGLDLAYPGFYQPLISQFRWCALIGLNVMKYSDHVSRENAERIKFHDHIYPTFGSGGLTTLTQLYSGHTPVFSNFMITLTLWILFQLIAKQIFYFIRSLIAHFTKNSKPFPKLSFKNHLCLCFGKIVDNFLMLYAFPFLIIVLWLMKTAGNGLFKVIKDSSNMLYMVFDVHTSYNSIMSAVLKFNRHNTTDFQQDTFDLPYQNSTFSLKAPINVSKASDIYMSGVPIGVPIGVMVSASITLALWLGLLSYFLFYYIALPKLNISRNSANSTVRLYTSQRVILMWGRLYNQLDPNKLEYIGFYSLVVIVRAAAVGLLQNHGAYSVGLLASVEAVNIICMLVYRPYFLKLRWCSSIYVLAISRFLVTLLCIPFIRELNVSEASKTYVAYCQFAIHSLVSLIFVIQLLYRLFITFRASVNSNHFDPCESLYLEKWQAENANNIPINDNFSWTSKDVFEYKAIGFPCAGTSGNPTLNPSPPEISPSSKNIIQDSDYFYRGNVNMSGSCQYHIDVECLSPDKNSQDFFKLYESNSCKPTPWESSYSSNFTELFEAEQKLSEARKLANNYAVREGDNIYKRYYDENPIDSEIQALWENRDDFSNPITTFIKGNTSTSNRFKISNIIPDFRFLVKKPQPTKEKSFVVCRPKQRVPHNCQERNAN